LASLIRVLLASDLHGSNGCFQKLVDLALELKVDSIVVAGDWSGKRSILYERLTSGEVAYQFGEKTGRAADYLASSEQWKNAGLYPIDKTAINQRDDAESLTLKSMTRRLRQWLDYGETKCGRAGIELISIPGNDDGKEVTNILSEHPWVRNIDCQRQHLGDHEIFGLGYSNLTPWHTPRELPEEQLKNKLSMLASQLTRPQTAIGVIHVPPFGTGLDLAPELKRNQSGRYQITGNGNIFVGSTAVREFVQQVSPSMILSGHCHSSRNLAWIGHTVCFNAGSQYHVSRLSACLILISDSGLVDYQFIVR
jgi:Icc-related predicted phosphoesterase